MADERPLQDRLLDLALYVPVGVLASLAEEMPAFAEKGRELLNGQFQVARMVGKFAVAEAQRRVGKAATASRPASAPAPAPETPESSATPREAAPAEPVVRSERRGDAEAPAGAGVPDVSTLPIPGYDTLAASQVVQRLGSLRADELDAVRRYEVATRGRRTILHRIGQLSSENGRASA